MFSKLNLTFLEKIYKKLAVELKLHERYTISTFLVFGFLCLTTLEMVTDLLDSEVGKRKKHKFPRLMMFLISLSVVAGKPVALQKSNRSLDFMPKAFYVLETLSPVSD